MSIVYFNPSEKYHPLFPDLVNNEYLFNFYYLNKKVDTTQTWSDDSDYSSYVYLPDIIDDILKNPSKYKDFTARVPSDWIYTSSKKIGGYDRPEDLLVNGGYETATESLKQKDRFNKERGFISADCPTMNGFLRWHYDKKGKVVGFTIVKNMGNHRFVLKKRSNGGKTVELLIKLHAHPVDPNESLEDIQCRESDSHHTDAQNQRGQTEEQKAYSGFKAKRKEYLELVDLLRDLQIDYGDILKQANLLDDSNNTPSISSVSKMNGGINSGVFSSLGFENVKWALATAREIALHDEQKEHLLKISHSAVMCFSNLYYYFTENFGDQTPIMSKMELRVFLLSTFTTRASKWKKVMSLNDLNQSGGQKDYNVINAVTLLKDLNDYYVEMIPTKASTKRKRGLGMENPAMKSFFNSITDRLQRNFAISESRIS